MDKKVIDRLEELVEKISHCYSSVPVEILDELNDLTKNEWTESEYIEFCAEYWSRSTLEETVYALLHDGVYPDNPEEDLYFWKNREVVDLPDRKVMFELRALPETVNEDFVSKFDDLPVREFYDWMKSYFSDWTVDEEPSEDELQSGSFRVTFDYDKIEEYAKYKSVMLEAYGKKMIGLDCCNLYENEKKDILSFLNHYGLYLYEY